MTQFVPQPLGQAAPVRVPGDVAFGQLGRAAPDLGDGQTHPLAGADHGDAAQHVAEVAALVAGGAVAGKLGAEVLWSDLAGDGAGLGVIGRSGLGGADRRRRQGCSRSDYGGYAPFVGLPGLALFER